MEGMHLRVCLLNPIQVAQRLAYHPPTYQGALVSVFQSCLLQLIVPFQVRCFINYINNQGASINWDTIENRGSIPINLEDLCSNVDLIREFPNLKDEIFTGADHYLKCLGLAAHTILVKKRGSSSHPAPQSYFNPNDVPMLVARATNCGTPLPLKSVKANQLGRLICVRGTVVRVSQVRPKLVRIVFRCLACQNEEQVALSENMSYQTPSRCTAKGCKSKMFQPLRDSPSTETIDYQTIRIQEIVSSATESGTSCEDSYSGGRIPRHLECELTRDLVDSCVPGDVVIVCGIVIIKDESGSSSKMTGNSSGAGKNCLFTLNISVSSLTNCKSRSSAVRGAGSSADDSRQEIDDEFSLKELYAIEAIHEERQLFRLLVASFCPGIYGHEIIKAGLLLALFGGVTKGDADKNKIPIRGDSHILVVGDPGLGKSQMLQSAANIAPRSVFVCGNTTSTAGLTVTLSREQGTSGYALEAGALVLADQGCCCIDEFDKMQSQHHALLEAMEQQCISLAKGGIVCTLPARCSILAAANPVSGHYSKAKTVSENLKMSSALLSRFDLVFIMLDRPDEELDHRLSNHVMSMHSRNSRSNSPFYSSESASDVHNPNRSIKVGNIFQSPLTSSAGERTLSYKLKVARTEEIDTIPPHLLTKYIAYARKYVFPKLTAEAGAVLQDFYLELRRQHHNKDSTPITTRQLESLIRLTEARARAELREEATEEDALDVRDLMRESMLCVFSDELGALDFSRSQNGCGMTGKSAAKRLISALQNSSESRGVSLFTKNQISDVAKEIGIKTSSIDSLFYSLNAQGYLLQRGHNLYKLQTAGF